jgi:hypothetical protein
LKYFSLEHKKFLVEHFVFDAWQFIDNAAKGVATTIFCYNTVRKLIEQSNDEYFEWQNNMFSKLFDDAQKNGKAHIGLRYDDMPKDVVDFLGDQISRSFLVDKYIKDFFQYARNTFDSLAQITNVALLANNAKNIEKVDFVKMENILTKPPFSGDFPDTETFFKRIKASDEFIYLSEFNNRIKHICDSELVLSHSLLNDKHTSQISAFYKKGQQFKQENILDIVKIICSFVETEFNIFLETITKDIKNDMYVNDRIHSLKVQAQHIKGDPDNSFAVIYINVVSNIDELSDEISILLINNNDEDVLVSNCEYDTILVRDASEEYIGKFVIKDIIVDDTLYKYFKYEKVKCDGMIAFFEEMKKTILIKPAFLSGTIVEAGI